MCSTPPDEDEVGCAHRDLAGARRRRGQRSRAHPVDREAGDGVREAGEQRDVAAERQALVADLRRRGEDHVADPLDRHRRVAAEQLADDLDGHVVGARLPEEAARPGLAERGADAVDEDDLVALAPHADEDSPFSPDSRVVLCDDGGRRPAGGAGLLWLSAMEEHIAESQNGSLLPRFAWILKGPARGPRCVGACGRAGGRLQPVARVDLEFRRSTSRSPRDRCLPRFAWILKGPARGPRCVGACGRAGGRLQPVARVDLGSGGHVEEAQGIVVATLRVDPEGARSAACVERAAGPVAGFSRSA